MRLRSFIILAFCLLVVGFWPAPTAPQQVHSMQVGQPVDWTPLAAAVDAQTSWYSTLPQPTTTTSVRRSGTVTAAAHGGYHKGYATAKECVANTENGGDYGRSSNPTHKGRYQFGRPAWISYGGVPEHWDNWDLASPVEQDTVFENAWSQGPVVQEQQWLRWDGC